MRQKWRFLRHPGLIEKRWRSAFLLQPGIWDTENPVFSFAMKDSGYRAVVDDLAARRCAQVLGIQTLGSGGLLVLAKRRGLINSVKGRVQRLRDAGLYLSDSVVQLLISEAGE